MMKKFFILSILFFGILFPNVSFAEETPFLNVYFFNGLGCPHCFLESKFLESIKDEYPNLRVHSLEVYFNKENVKKFQAVAKALGTEAGGVPFLVIGDEYFVGFSEEISPEEIKSRLNECKDGSCLDTVAKIVGVPAWSKTLKAGETSTSTGTTTQAKKIFKLPILGEVDPVHFSLPLITIVLGALDGFNPCAMWTLLFLISMLLGMQDKKRMWILGGAFIFASAFVYFLFMSAWLNIILFIGFVAWLKILIGGVSLFGGGYNLKEFFTNTAGTCKVGDEEQKEKVFEKLKMAVGQRNFWLALVGIILLAFVVNLIELVCSAGLPVVFTQILVLNHLSFWQYYFYILLYIFFFMLDDLFIFFVSMMTLEMTGITSKYSRFSKLIGGTLMIIIGLLLLFKPEWLMFG